MCGISGIFDLKKERRIEDGLVNKMLDKLTHRGPEAVECFSDGNIALGFARLSIIGLENGMQPIFNKNHSIVLICNGEIFNYIELKNELVKKGHIFTTESDVEVILHLYEEKGQEFINDLNGQFAFVLYDFKNQQLFCVRDHFGIIPFFYTITNDFFIFGSEIKAILEHPAVKREIDLVGLDQIFSFPGNISPRTMFKNIRSLENGHYLLINDKHDIKDVEYWDLIYPEIGEIDYFKDENNYVEKLDQLITDSVKMRLRSDVPIGLYLSGGLDSSIIAAKTNQLNPNIRRETFSIIFNDKDITEAKYQNIMHQKISSNHNKKLFLTSDIINELPKAVYHSEIPLKETYNTASLALSKMVNDKNIKVVLTGEGADELFAGYVGYRFDKFRSLNYQNALEENLIKGKLQNKVWGDESFFYERDLCELGKLKKGLYSNQINEKFESIDCLNEYVIKKERICNRDLVHKRSYIDFKLRMADHLISDHGDRMTFANSVEGRYPFLDKNLVEFVKTIPPELKLKGFEEKYILKRMAEKYVPNEIIKREKFSFVAPGSSHLLKQNVEYINDLLSYEKIRKQGYFNPDNVEKLKNQYISDGFKLNLPFDSDLLIIVLTFGIFLEKFNMPNIN